MALTTPDAVRNRDVFSAVGWTWGATTPSGGPPLVLVGLVAVTALGGDFETSLGSVVRALSNMGPALGEAGPTANFAAAFSLPARRRFDVRGSARPTDRFAPTHIRRWSGVWRI